MSTIATLGPFEHAVMPNGDEVFYRDSDHSYWARIALVGDKWQGIQDHRLCGVTTAVKPLDHNPDHLMDYAARLGPNWRQERNKRAASGTLVHKQALHALATGRPVPDFEGMTDEEHGLARAVLAFWHEWEPVTELSEQIVYSKMHGIAGRLDWIGYIKHNGFLTRVLLDLKTKANGASGFVPVKHHGQLAMYDLLAEECGVGSTDEQWILLVKPDGTYEPPILNQATHEDALAALQVYRAAQRIGKAMKAQRCP